MATRQICIDGSSVLDVGPTGALQRKDPVEEQRCGTLLSCQVQVGRSQADGFLSCRSAPANCDFFVCAATPQATASGTIVCCFRFPRCEVLSEPLPLLGAENLFGAATASPTSPGVFEFAGGGATINPPALVNGGFLDDKFSIALSVKPDPPLPNGYLGRTQHRRVRLLGCCFWRARRLACRPG